MLKSAVEETEQQPCREIVVPCGAVSRSANCTVAAFWSLSLGWGRFLTSAAAILHLSLPVKNLSNALLFLSPKYQIGKQVGLPCNQCLACILHAIYVLVFLTSLFIHSFKTVTLQITVLLISALSCSLKALSST